jgi:sarcosine oxidase
MITPRTFDAIVVGLGAHGSAAAYALARRGARVLGLDRFAPPHARGSSHGETRMIREAYFEHPSYVPLVQRAYERWRDLERASERRLLVATGGLMIGRADSTLVEGALRSAREHALAYELLDAGEVRRRFPPLQLTDDMVAVWEPRAGFLFPEACIDVQLALARAHGAELRVSDQVVTWDAREGDVTVGTAEERYTAARLILAAGAWMPKLVPELASILSIERQVLAWFEPAYLERLTQERFPVYIIEHAPQRYVYGFPAIDGAAKIARHHEGEPSDPDAPRRDVSDEEIDGLRALAERFVPDVAGPLYGTQVCLYTNTLDGHFLLDRHPAHDTVLLVSACSGHGFKFASVVGEIVADLVLEGRTETDLRLFRYGRWRTES